MSAFKCTVLSTIFIFFFFGNMSQEVPNRMKLAREMRALSKLQHNHLSSHGIMGAGGCLPKWLLSLHWGIWLGHLSYEWSHCSEV